jgi:hypothetical protein
MNKTFIIDGGAGRVITAIPALEKYQRLNPNKDFKVVIHGWESLYWSNPILQQRTIDINQKNIFEQYIKSNEVVYPEPYFQHDYYNQRISLAEAFDREINNTSDHGDLGGPNLYLSTYEQNLARNMLNQFKEQHKKNKVVVIQPYGSGMQIINDKPLDSTNRSIDCDDYLYLIENLSQDCLIIFFGAQHLRHPADNISIDLQQFNPDLRVFMSIINECDYFIGCDSVGQHMARAFNKPGAVFMGSTFEKNVSYPDHFKIFRKPNHKPVYSPIRLTREDSHFADRLNDGIMKYTQEELKNWCSIINFEIHKQREVLSVY